MRITRIKAQNFRCIGDVDLEIRPFTVLIGPNGAGKSSLLEVFRLFGLIHQGGGSLSKFFSSFGGFKATVPYFVTDPRMQFGIALTKEGESVDYSFDLMGEGSSYFVTFEKFKSGAFGFERDDMTCGYVDSQNQQTMFQLPHGANFAFQTNQVVKNEMNKVFVFGQGISYFKVHKFQPNARVRSPQQMIPTAVPSDEGENLFSALWSLRTDHQSEYRDLIDVLRVAVPELEEIDFPIAGAGHVDMTWKQSNLKKKLYATQLSDGTLRLLWLLTVLHAVPEGGTILIDEPELGFHPEWLMLLVSVMRKVAARATVVVATQSSEFVRWVKKDELVVSDITESGSVFKWASDRGDLDKWLEDFTLSELWTMGELGGRR